MHEGICENCYGWGMTEEFDEVLKTYVTVFCECDYGQRLQEEYEQLYQNK